MTEGEEKTIEQLRLDIEAAEKDLKQNPSYYRAVTLQQLKQDLRNRFPKLSIVFSEDKERP